jgi:hypothetical protein
MALAAYNTAKRHLKKVAQAAETKPFRCDPCNCYSLVYGPSGGIFGAFGGGGGGRGAAEAAAVVLLLSPPYSHYRRSALLRDRCFKGVTLGLL